MSVARSIAISVAGSVAGSVTLADGGSGGSSLPTLPFNAAFVLDADGDYLLDADGDYVVAYESNTVEITYTEVEAADITTIGYFQLFDSVKATGSAVLFTPVDLSSASDPYESGGIFWSGGTLRNDLPAHAFAGDPDQIIIEIDSVEVETVDV